jgi:hypothetical protein
MKTNILFLLYLSQFTEWEIFQKKLQRISKHTFYIQKRFFSEIMPFKR